MKKTLISIFTLIAAGTVAVSSARELPTRTIGGKTYYVYTVRGSDTLDALTSHLGITRAELIRYNPSASDGLSAGQVIIFPVGEYDNATGSEAVQSSDSPAFTTYTIKGNETIFGVAHRFGVSPETIVELNPQASSGVRQGMRLKLPAAPDSYKSGNTARQVSQTPDTPSETQDSSNTSSPAAPSRNSGPSVLQNDKNVPGLLSSEFPDSSSAPEPVEIIKSAPATDTIRITLALPLMSDSEKISRTANNYNEFYRGFLIGAQSIAVADSKSDDNPTPVSISLIDTSIDPLTSASISDDSFVIVGEDEDDIAHAAQIAGDRTFIMNVFNLRGDQYLTHPNVFHAGINQQMMFDRAISYLLDNYGDYTPVILSREGSRAEKQSFIDALRLAMAEAGRDIIEYPYSGKLPDDIEIAQRPGRFIFIPTSGSLTDFNHFAPVVKKLRDADPDPDRLKVFGYPDWIAFRGEPRTMMQQLGASFYSRFADIEGNADAANVLNDYTAWYGSTATEGVPNQALLGYDTARYLISGLRRNGTPSNLLSDGTLFQGVQSTIHIEKAVGTNSGYINGAIFIITCSENGSANITLK